MVFNVEGDTLDWYKQLLYYVPVVEYTSQHKDPYVAVQHQGSRIARIMLKDRKPDFYNKAQSPAIERAIQEWIDKENNFVGAVRRWNKLNPSYAWTPEG